MINIIIKMEVVFMEIVTVHIHRMQNTIQQMN